MILNKVSQKDNQIIHEKVASAVIKSNVNKLSSERSLPHISQRYNLFTFA